MSVIPALSVYAPLSAQPTTSLLSSLAATAGSDFVNLLGGSSIVQLSGFGQLLSAAETFRNSLTNLKPGAADSGLGQNFGTDFGSLAAEAQNFVDTFNTLQGTLGGLQASGALTENALAARFSQALDTAATSAFANDTGPTTLADIGITLQSGTGTLSIDLQALQAAYQANASGTFSLLAQAATSLGDVAGGVMSQVGAESAALADLASTSGLSLLLGTGSTTTGAFGLANLLALSSLTAGSATTLTQQLLALNEFSLVSTLIG